MDWKYSLFEEDWEQPSTVIYDQETYNFTGNAGLKGIAFNPHARCETVNLLFDREGNTSGVTMQAFLNIGVYSRKDAPMQWFKTQFAGAEVHIGMVHLLQYIKKKYIPNLKVNDETGYWDTNNAEDVEDCIGIIDTSIDMIEGIAQKSGSMEDFLGKLDSWLKKKS